MTEPHEEKVTEDELEDLDPEALPDREAMTILSFDGPVAIPLPVDEIPPPGSPESSE